MDFEKEDMGMKKSLICRHLSLFFSPIVVWRISEQGQCGGVEAIKLRCIVSRVHDRLRLGRQCMQFPANTMLCALHEK
jgi:hypothetical protein